LKTAKALGLTISETFLPRANQLIERRVFAAPAQVSNWHIAGLSQPSRMSAAGGSWRCSLDTCIRAPGAKQRFIASAVNDLSTVARNGDAMYQQAVTIIIAVGLIAAAIMLTNHWALNIPGLGTPNSVLLDRCCIDRSRLNF
jgi:hypothetical protein